MKGGWNIYNYPLNPVTNTDPLGLEVLPGPFPLPIPWPKSPAQQQADDNAAKALSKWLNDTFKRVKCLPATPQNIKKLVSNCTLMTLQRRVSVSVIDLYTKMLEDNSVPPPVKMDGNVIVDGNHRMIAALLCDTEAPRVPGTRPLTREVYPLSEIEPDVDDWGNR